MYPGRRPRFGKSGSSAHRLKVGENIFPVGLGLHLGVDFFNHTVLIDEEGTAQDAVKYTTHELLFAPCAKGFDGATALVGEKWVWEFVLRGEVLLSLHRIFADANNLDTLLVEL